LIPSRKIDGHKGSFGHVMVVGGSRKYSGAPMMTTFAALKSGAGLTTLASVTECLNLTTIKIPEAIRLELGDGEYIDPNLLEEQFKKWNEKDFIFAIGPGIGRDQSLLEKIRELFNRIKKGVLDADGLYSLKRGEKVENGEEKIITPHPGEAAHLLGTTTAEINRDRISAARSLAVEYGVNVLLKGIGTIIVTFDGRVFINSTGNSALSKGGSGDVLTGIIAGFAAQGVEMWKSGVLGAYLHGLTGENLGNKYSDYSVLATEIAENLGKTINSVR